MGIVDIPLLIGPDLDAKWGLAASVAAVSFTNRMQILMVRLCFALNDVCRNVEANFVDFARSSVQHPTRSMSKRERENT